MKDNFELLSMYARSLGNCRKEIDCIAKLHSSNLLTRKETGDLLQQVVWELDNLLQNNLEYNSDEMDCLLVKRKNCQ